jgi:hypothetical protein
LKLGGTQDLRVPVEKETMERKRRYLIVDTRPGAGEELLSCPQLCGGDLRLERVHVALRIRERNSDVDRSDESAILSGPCLDVHVTVVTEGRYSFTFDRDTAASVSKRLICC